MRAGAPGRPIGDRPARRHRITPQAKGDAMTPEQAAVDVPAHVVEYLSAQNTLTLATASASGVPHASTFLYVSDGPTLYFWLRPGTITARHLDQNPIVSFAIDEYAQDLRQTRGVQGSGGGGVGLHG